MKKLLPLILFIFIPLLLSAKYYKSTVVYNDGESVDVLVKFPLATTAANLVIKKSEDADTERIDRENIALVILYLNNGEDTYYFVNGQIGYYLRNGRFQRMGIFKRRSLALVQNAYDDVVVSESGFKYLIQKSRKEKKEKVVIVYEQGMYGYYLSRMQDTILLNMNIPGMRLQNLLERGSDRLFPDCPSIKQKIENSKLRKVDQLEEVLKFYANCN